MKTIQDWKGSIRSWKIEISMIGPDSRGVNGEQYSFNYSFSYTTIATVKEHVF